MRTRTLPHESEIEAAVGGFEKWAHNCHAASLALVKTGLLGEQARVARGSCIGVTGQHSWAVIGGPYDPTSTIVDITLWSYQPQHPKVWVGNLGDGLHRPHGLGDIFEWGVPLAGDGEGVALSTPLSPQAQRFIERVAAINGRHDGTLDIKGWMALAHAPMQGWPSAEIIAAMHDTAGLRALIPIDIVGMVTDRNPEGLYR